MQFSSPAFGDQEFIPEKCTCNGPSVSPPLIWGYIPKMTESLVLFILDVDAKPVPWVHWLVYHIPVDSGGFNEASIPEGAQEGIGNGGTFGYEGPCPKYFFGIHHYHFCLYALDCFLSIEDTANAKVIRKAMKDHILAEAGFIGLAQGKR